MVTAMLLSAKAARYSNADGVGGQGDGHRCVPVVFIEDEEEEEEDVDDMMMRNAWRPDRIRM